MKDGGSKVLPAKKQRRENKLTPYLFLLPTILLMGTFIYYPFVKTIGTSFFLTNATGKAVEFIGLEIIRRYSATACLSSPSRIHLSTR